MELSFSVKHFPKYLMLIKKKKTNNFVFPSNYYICVLKITYTHIYYNNKTSAHHHLHTYRYICS